MSLETSENVQDTFHPPKDVRNLRSGPTVWRQQLPGLSQRPLGNFPSSEKVSDGQKRTEQPSTPRIKLAFQKGLAARTSWYSDASFIHHAEGSVFTDELHEPWQFAINAITMQNIEHFTRSSSNRIAKPIRTTALTGTQPGCHRLMFSPDSKVLAVTSTEGTVGLWSIEKFSLVRASKNLGIYVTFSTDSRYLAAVEDGGSACVVEAILDGPDKGAWLSLRGLAKKCLCIAYSLGGEQVAVGTSRGTIVTWDSKTGKSATKIKSHPECVIWIAYYPYVSHISGNEYQIVAAGADGWFRFWEHEARSVLPDRWVLYENKRARGRDKEGLNILSKISAVAASKTFSRLAVANLDGSVTVWYNEQGRHWIEGLDRESVLLGHKGRIDTVEFSPDSRLLVSASKGSVKVWQVRGGLPVFVVPHPDGIIRSIAFSPDSYSLAMASSDGSITLWNAQDMQDFNNVQDHLDRASFFMAISPDLRYTASVVRELRSKNTLEKDTIARSGLVNQRTPVDNDIATLMIWSVAMAKPLTLLSGHEAEILSISFSEDSRRLGSISTDHDLRIWDIETGKCLSTIKSRTNAEDTVPCAAISTGLRYCASVVRYRVDHFSDSHSGFAISLCDVRPESRSSTGTYPCISLTGTVVENDILALSFSLDGTKLAALDQNDNVTVWDTANGSMTAWLSDIGERPPHGRSRFDFTSKSSQHSAQDLLSAYRKHMLDLDSPGLHFTNTGMQLVASSGLGMVRLWNIENEGELVSRIRPTIGNSSRGNKAGQKADNENNAFRYCSYNFPLASSPDGARCVASYSSHYPPSKSAEQVALWDLGRGEAILILAEYMNCSGLRLVSFSPDSQWLVTTSTNGIKVREAATGRETIHITAGLSSPLRMLTFWPDSGYLVSGCYKGMVQFWDVNTGALVITFKGHTGWRKFEA